MKTGQSNGLKKIKDSHRPRILVMFIRKEMRTTAVKTMNAMNRQMKATWRKMVGTALLWAALAALVYVPSCGDGGKGTIVAVLGFVSFASGLALFADGLKRDIVAQLRREQGDHSA